MQLIIGMQIVEMSTEESSYTGAIQNSCPENVTEIHFYFLRSSRPEELCKKGVLRNFAKFIGKHLCRCLFFNKLAGLGISMLSYVFFILIWREIALYINIAWLKPNYDYRVMILIYKLKKKNDLKYFLYYNYKIFV